MTKRSRGVFVLAVVAGVGYAGFFLSTSLTSQERVLPVGTAYHFCGFYLDCHLSVAVESVVVTPLAGGGERYTVQVRFASDARRATMELRHPGATLVDDLGAQVEPASGPTGARLSPDSSMIAEFIFDARTPLVNPRLRMVKGDRIERMAEVFLIGDPDSFLHPPVTLALR